MCLQQILTGNKLRNCRIEQAKMKLPHIQELQNGRRLISTNNTILHRIRTPTQRNAAGRTAIWSENIQIFIPSTALITIPNESTIYCPEFNLPGPTTPDARPTINIIKNLSTSEETNEIVDIHQGLVQNTTWNKQPYLNVDIQELILEMLEQATQSSKISYVTLQKNQHLSRFTIYFYMMVVILIIIIIISLIWYWKRPSNNKLMIMSSNATV